MNDPMNMLKADHREVKAMLKTLAEIDEGAEREELCRKVSDALTLHMAIEEQLLYPLISQLIGAEEEEEANTEHGLAKDGLATMVSLVAKPGFGAAVEMLAGGINHHVEEEETELLPQLKSDMDRQDWLALGDRIAEAKAAAGAEPSAPAKRRSAKRSGSRASASSNNSRSNNSRR